MTTRVHLEQDNDLLRKPNDDYTVVELGDAKFQMSADAEYEHKSAAGDAG